MSDCPCGSGAAFSDCCGRYIQGGETAPTAESLMRSRYTAYTRCDVGYLRRTLDPSVRDSFDEEGARKWAESARWLGLEVMSSSESGDEGEMEFTARFEMDGRPHEHREKARFHRIGGVWYFVEGRARGGATPMRAAPKAGRNDPCPCGSGKKFKKCCGT